MRKSTPGFLGDWRKRLLRSRLVNCRVSSRKGLSIAVISEKGKLNDEEIRRILAFRNVAVVGASSDPLTE